MQSNSFTVAGDRVVVDNSFGTGIPPSSNQITTYSRVTSFRSTFTVIDPGQTGPFGNRFTYVKPYGSRSIYGRDPNPIQFRKDWYSMYEGTQILNRVSNGALWQQISGFFGDGCPLVSEPEGPTHIYNMALGRLYDDLRNPIDLSVDVFQGRQTAKMFKTVASVVRFVKKFDPVHLATDYLAWRQMTVGAQKVLRGRTGFDRKKWRTGIRSPGSYWLEYVYGWKPLVEDVFGAVVELSRQCPPLMKVEGIGKESFTKRFELVDANGNFTIPALVDYKCSNRCRIRCQYDFGFRTHQLISNFTSVNPVSIAWELLPFSFVYDWFHDVGGYLRTLETALLNDVSFVQGYYTETQMISAVAQINGAYRASGFDQYYSKRSTRGHVWKKRTVLSSSPRPRPPQFRMDLGSGRLMNAAALVSQLLSRGR